MSLDGGVEEAAVRTENVDTVETVDAFRRALWSLRSAAAEDDETSAFGEKFLENVGDNGDASIFIEEFAV